MRICLASASARRAELLRRLGVDFFSQAADINEDPHSNEAPQDYVLRLAFEKAQAVLAQGVRAPILAADTTVVLNGEIFGKPENATDAARMLARLSGCEHEVWTAVAWFFPHDCLTLAHQNCPPERLCFRVDKQMARAARHDFALTDLAIEEPTELQRAACPNVNRPLTYSSLDFSQFPTWQNPNTPQHAAWQMFDLPAFFAPSQNCPPENTQSALSGGQNPRIFSGKLLRSCTRVQFYPLCHAQIHAYIASGEPFDKAGAYAIQGLGECFVQNISGSFSNIMGLPLAEVAAIVDAYHLPFALQSRAL